MIEGSAQHYRIVAEAKKRGFEIEEVDAFHTVLRKGSVVFHLKYGIIQEWLTEKSLRTCKEKGITKELFEKLKIPSPKSYRFATLQDLQEVKWDKEYVAKPEAGTSGKGVQLYIASIGDVQKYLNEVEASEKIFLLEEFVEGKDLRIQVIGGKIVAACERIPASVIGDGESSLQQLIDKREEEVKRQNPSNSLPIGAESLRLINAQGFELTSIIPKGDTVFLKEIANIGQGARAVDCTEKIDFRVEKWINSIARELKAPYFALDIICTDPTTIETYWALEINLEAEWFHHTFSEKRQHNLEVQIVNELEKEP